MDFVGCGAAPPQSYHSTPPISRDQPDLHCRKLHHPRLTRLRARLLHGLTPKKLPIPHCGPSTVTTAAIPLQTRKRTCPPSPRGQELPAESDRVDDPDSDVPHEEDDYDSHTHTHTDPEQDHRRPDNGSSDPDEPLELTPPDDSKSLAQHFRVFMSRAPLLRTSPALGSSSYGGVRIPQDESDDNDDNDSDVAARHDKPAREWSPGRLQRASFDSSAEGPSSDALQQRRRLSKSKQSHSSGRRRSSALYTEGHKRRPSSATSDVGMGADSKYSFATGLAVPGNPVMQETPVSSPYMTTDDEDVLDIDDENTKPFDEDPPDNSPYVLFLTDLSAQRWALLVAIESRTAN